MNEPKFIRPHVSLDCIARGRQDFAYKVTGYWSEPVTLYLKRKFIWRDEELEATEVIDRWEFEMSHSSGGYEKDAHPIESERNLALAILDACELVEILKDNIEYYEQVYQLHDAEEKRRNKIESDKRQAKIDADPAMSEESAKSLLTVMKDSVPDYWDLAVCDVRVRGKDWESEPHDYSRRYVRITCKQIGSCNNRRVQWRYNGDVISYKRLLEWLQELADDFKLDTPAHREAKV